MKVLLVGNYEFDGATSMKVWAGALQRELANRGIDVRMVCPHPVFGRLRRSAGGLGKWLGYIDRFMIFPRQLREAAGDADIVHICDHGSAIYTSALRGKPTVVTCHDMLAVRGALGEAVDCPATFFGRALQRKIRRGLSRATRVACVSRYTLNDAQRILNGGGNLRLVLNGLNYPFHPLDSAEIDCRLAHLPAAREPFVLHVGSNLVRKNRAGVLRIFARASEGTDLRLLFAGAQLSPELAAQARALRIDDRIVEVEKPAVEILEALYNRADALVFPSRYEGFGWPPIEAQACGCPVVASNIPPLAEVLGQSAELRPVEDEAGMAEVLRRLWSDRAYRQEMKQHGLENVRSRFQTSRMMNEYVTLYRELA